MADISAEIAAFKNAVYGEEVRNAMISLANKLNNVVDDATNYIRYKGDLATNTTLSTVEINTIYRGVAGRTYSDKPSGITSNFYLLTWGVSGTMVYQLCCSINQSVYKCYQRYYTSASSTINAWIDLSPFNENGSVTTSKIADGAVTLAKLGNDVEIEPPDGSITNSKIADGAVTLAKLGSDVQHIETINIPESDLEAGVCYNRFGTKTSAASLCLYSKAIPIDGVSIVSWLNVSIDTRLDVAWVTYNSLGQIVRYGTNPIIYVQSGETSCKINFTNTINSISNGRIVKKYYNYETIPFDDIDDACCLGNDILISPLSFIDGNWIMGWNGAWSVRSNGHATELITIPHGAIEVSTNLAPKLNDVQLNLYIFLNEDYTIQSYKNGYSTVSIPDGSRYVVLEIGVEYNSEIEYFVRFKMAEDSVQSIKADLNSIRDDLGEAILVKNESLIPNALCLTGSGMYDMMSIGTRIRFNGNSGWHYEKYLVKEGDLFQYHFVNPTTHFNYIVITDPYYYCIYDITGVDITGSITIPSGGAYLFVSLRNNATITELIKVNSKIPYAATKDDTNGITEFTIELMSSLALAGIAVNLNPMYYYYEHSLIARKSESTGLKFAILSDTHYLNNGTQPEFKRIFKELKRMQDSEMIDFVIHLGDLIDDSNVSFSNTTDIINNYGVKYFIIRGNHDLVKPSIIRNNCTNIQNVVFDSLGCWAYLDDSVNNVRYVFLNACDKGSDVDNDVNTIDMMRGDFSYRQLNWLANIALMTDKKIILFCHTSLKNTSSDKGTTITNSVSNYYSAGIIIDAFMQGISGSVAFTNTFSESDAGSAITYDFTTQGPGDAVCLFNGHGHGDLSFVSNYGLLTIMESNALCINNMSIQNGYTFKAIPDTINEVAFDVVNINPITKKIKLWRFGRGLDREYN